MSRIFHTAGRSATWYLRDFKSLFINISSGSLTNQFRRISYPQDRVAALCLATISGVILFGLTAAWPSWTHDGMIHLHRIRALADALRAGVIFPRWFPDYTFGYGYPALNYYAPGSYYPPALLHLAGLDIVLSLRLSLTVGFALSASWMFHLSRLYVSLWPAIVGVICFQFFPYRMIDLFVRGHSPNSPPLYGCRWSPTTRCRQWPHIGGQTRGPAQISCR